MTVPCIRCHHPLKHPTASGMGRVCEKKAGAAPDTAYERDLFGYDLERAQRAALYQVQVVVQQATHAALTAVHRAFDDNRRRARERMA